MGAPDLNIRIVSELDPRLRFVGGGMFLTLDEWEPRLRFVGGEKVPYLG